MKLLRILLLSFSAVVLISCGGAEDRKAVYLEKAKESFDSGDYEKSRIDLKNALQIDPKDSNAYYQLGNVFFELKDYRKAYSNFLKAEELNPELLANQAKLGNIYLYLIKDIGKAQEKIDFILLKEPNNSDGLLLQAGLKVSNKNLSEALNISEKIISRDPGHVDAAMFLSSLYIKDKKYDDAISVLDEALKINPGNVRLTNYLALSLVQNKEYERAEEIFKGNIEKDPENKVNYNALALYYKEIGDEVKAEEVLRSSIDNNPEDIERYFDLIKYISVIKGNEKAINELREMITKKPSLGKLRLALAEYLMTNEMQTEAIEIYQKAVDDFSNEVIGVDARLALARIYIKNKDFNKAESLIDGVLAISPNDTKANYLKATIALYNNDNEKAIIALRIVTKDEPENIKAFILLASTYKLNGDKELAKSALDKAYEVNKLNASGLLFLSKYYMARDIAQAEKVIDNYNKLKESDYEGLSLKAMILNKRKMYDQALKVSQTLIELYSDEPNGYLQSVPYYLNNSEPNIAISILENGYLSVNDNRNILIILSKMQIEQQKFDIVINRLEAELNVKPDDELKLILAKTVFANKDTNQSISLLKELVDSDAKLEEAYLLYAELVYRQNKDLEEVTSALERGASSLTSSINISIKLASVYELKNEYDKAIGLYRNLLESYPDNIIVTNNLLSLLSDYGDIKELKGSIGLVDSLVDSQKPVFLDTVGWVYYKLGNYQKAIVYLDKAVKAMPDISVFNYHAGMAYKMIGDKERAKEYLQRSLSTERSFKEKELAKSALNEL